MSRLEKIKYKYPFITIEYKDNIYYVYGYFNRLMFISPSVRKIEKSLKEIFI